MDFKILDKYLNEAIGKDKSQLTVDNPFRDIAFDAEKKRLGWLKRTPVAKIIEVLQDLDEFLKGKDQFVFLGIGGSGNGVKVVNSLFGGSRVLVLDSLDPFALLDLRKKIKSLDRTLVIPISKSGTTKETQLLALSLKSLFNEKWQEHFLWMSDPQAFDKLDNQGWNGTKKVAIQFDQDSDIGGRFSCPHTLIFFLPLYILLNKNINKIQKIYESYFSKLRDIRSQGYDWAAKCNELNDAFLHPIVDKKTAKAFSAWVVQLFQESLGSKTNLAVKTLEPFEKPRADFLQIKLNLKCRGPVAQAMAQMYFFQSFLVFYAALRKVNFVNQDFVEKYKEQMRQLEGSTDIESGFETMDLATLIKSVKERAVRKKFIEIVLFFDAKDKTVEFIRQNFAKALKDKKIFVFIGSDWNHHSYQAAFADRNTFFVLMFAPAYQAKIIGVADDTLAKNAASLKLIGKATYLTIKDKALLVILNDLKR